MSGVRVTCLPGDITVKEIKIYFSKPENGGGRVKAIYYPLHDEAAVVLFVDRDVAAFAAGERPSGRLRQAMIEKLPATQMYTTLTAELETPVAEFLQATPNVLEEIQYGSDLSYQHDRRSKVSTLRGNWYQLEWAWKHVEDMMARQSSAQRQIASRTARDTRGDARGNQGDNSVRRKGDQPQISMPVPETAGKSRTYGVKQTSYRNRIDSSESEQSEEEDNDTDQVSGRRGRAAGEESGSHRPTRSPDRGRKESSPRRTTPDRGSSRRATADSSEEDEAAGDTGARAQAAAGYQGSRTTEILNDKPEDPRSLDFRHGPIHVSIYSGNITLSESDAIVNASNEFLSHAGGVAYAIASAASQSLVDECERHIRDNGYLSVSDVMHTCAGGRLSPKVKHIIHAVGPIWQSGPDTRSSYLLTRTFLNIMNYANTKLKIKSITMPLISSGVFGGSLEGCVQAFFTAVLIFVREHCGAGQPVALREVHLINNNTDSTVITVTQIRERLTAVGQLDKMADSAVEEFNKMSLEVDIVKRRVSPQTRATDLSSSVRSDRYKSMPSSIDFSRSLSTSSQPTSLSSISARSGSSTDDDFDRTLGASGATNLGRSSHSSVDQKRTSYSTRSISQGYPSMTGVVDRSQGSAGSRLGQMTSTGQSPDRVSSTRRHGDAGKETTPHTHGRALPSAPSSSPVYKKK